MEKAKIVTGNMAIEAEGDGAMDKMLEYMEKIDVFLR